MEDGKIGMAKHTKEETKRNRDVKMKLASRETKTDSWSYEVGKQVFLILNIIPFCRWDQAKADGAQDSVCFIIFCSFMNKYFHVYEYN